MYMFMVGQYSDTDNLWKNAFEQSNISPYISRQYRRRQVVDQCSSWKERPLLMFTIDLFNLYNRNIFKTSLYIYIFQDEKCRLMRNLSLSMILLLLKY